MWWPAVAAPWWLLSVAMALDELYFHRRRGLPRWERVGHPVDTACALACFAVALLAPAGRLWQCAFGVLCGTSMILIIKDEHVHLRHCGAGEARLHAALFMLHPLALLSALTAWLAPTGLLEEGQARRLRLALTAQLALTASFFAYQVLYWNFLCAPDPASTTDSTID